MSGAITGLSSVIYTQPFTPAMVHEIFEEQKRTKKPVVIAMYQRQIRASFIQEIPTHISTYGGKRPEINQGMLTRTNRRKRITDAQPERDTEVGILLGDFDAATPIGGEIRILLVVLVGFPNSISIEESIRQVDDITKGYVILQAIKAYLQQLYSLKDKKPAISKAIETWLSIVTGNMIVDLNLLRENGAGPAIDNILSGTGDIDGSFSILLHTHAKIHVESLYAMPGAVNHTENLTPAAARRRHARYILHQRGLLRSTYDCLLESFASQFETKQVPVLETETMTIELPVSHIAIAVDHMLRQVIECSPTVIMAIPYGKILDTPWTWQGDDGCVNYPSIHNSSFFKEVVEIAHRHLRRIAEKAHQNIECEYTEYPSQLHIVQPNERSNLNRLRVPIFTKYLHKGRGKEALFYEDGETYYTALVNLSSFPLKIKRKDESMRAQGIIDTTLDPGEIYIYQRPTEEDPIKRYVALQSDAVTVCVNCTLVVSVPKRTARTKREWEENEAIEKDGSAVFKNYLHSGNQSDTHTASRRSMQMELYRQEDNLVSNMVSLQKCMIMQRDNVARNFGTRCFLFLDKDNQSSMCIQPETSTFNYPYWSDEANRTKTFEEYAEDAQSEVYKGGFDPDLFELTKNPKNANQSLMLYPKSMPPLNLYNGLISDFFRIKN